MKFTFKVGVKIKEAWKLYKEHFGSIMLLVLISVVLQVLSQSYSEKSFLVAIFVVIVGILLAYVWIKSVLNLLDGKGFHPFSRESLPSLLQFWNFLKTNILIGIITVVGFLLFIVPGLYLAGRLFPAKYLPVEKNQGARKNIKESWEMTKGNAWRLLWKSILIGLFIILGLLAFVIGLFITYPIGMIVLVMMYRDFVKFKTNPEQIATETPKEEVKVEQPE